MCIVIDINTLASVFSESAEDHCKFAPVADWILNGRGFLVYGGTKYMRELHKTKKYLDFVKQLQVARKAVVIDQLAVDKREKEIISITVDTDCDDQHIIAIHCVSGCRLLCSKDSRSYKFVRNRMNYPKGVKRPAIYCGRRSNSRLLRDENIVNLKGTDGS
jgi:hypothetical protein